MSSAEETFDPYRHWLNIEAPQRPVDYYDLLGLARFENDAAIIEHAFDDRMRLIRSFQTGPRGRYTQKLLSEIASAKRCLLSSAFKAAYDAALFANAELPSAELPPEVLPISPSHPEPVPRVASAAATTGERDNHQSDASNKFAAVWYGVAISVVLAITICATFAVAKFRRRSDAATTAAMAQTSAVDHAQPPEDQSGGSQVIESPANDPSAPVIEVLQEGNGLVLLSPATAAVSGGVEMQTLDVDDVLGGWTGTAASATWQCKLLKTGYFQARVSYASKVDHDLRIQVDDRAPEPIGLPATGGADRYREAAAPLIIRNPGSHRIVLSSPRSASDLRIKLVTLQPAESSSGK